MRESKSRKDYFYDILVGLDENVRRHVLNAILSQVRDEFPEKAVALEAELDGA